MCQSCSPVGVTPALAPRAQPALRAAGWSQSLPQGSRITRLADYPAAGIGNLAGIQQRSGWHQGLHTAISCMWNHCKLFSLYPAFPTARYRYYVLALALLIWTLTLFIKIIKKKKKDKSVLAYRTPNFSFQRWQTVRIYLINSSREKCFNVHSF